MFGKHGKLLLFLAQNKDCSETEYRCLVNVDTCVPEEYRCDYVSDCGPGDNSDEADGCK